MSKEFEELEEKKKNKDVSLSEENILDSKREKRNKSKRKKKILLYICIFILIIIFLVIVFFKMFYPKLSTYLENKPKENIELKYTETNNTNNDGIYITDVSEVVENVMPSIVAITSKTLISSGRFGPFYFGEEQYSEGAGSGIIISKSDEELMILTNNHVVEGANELAVQFINEKSFDAKIVGTSERKDIAIISVSLDDIDSDTLNEIKIATLGDPMN